MASQVLHNAAKCLRPSTPVQKNSFKGATERSQILTPLHDCTEKLPPRRHRTQPNAYAPPRLCRKIASQVLQNAPKFLRPSRWYGERNSRPTAPAGNYRRRNLEWNGCIFANGLHLHCEPIRVHVTVPAHSTGTCHATERCCSSGKS